MSDANIVLCYYPSMRTENNFSSVGGRWIDLLLDQLGFINLGLLSPACTRESVFCPSAKVHHLDTSSDG